MVHHDIKIQNEDVMSKELGVTHCRSSKKKLNKKGSKESDLLGASYYVPYNIWYIMFMHHQGYLNNSNSYLQVNKRATRMEINGRNFFIGNS